MKVFLCSLLICLFVCVCEAYFHFWYKRFCIFIHLVFYEPIYELSSELKLK